MKSAGTREPRFPVSFGTSVRRFFSTVGVGVGVGVGALPDVCRGSCSGICLAYAVALFFSLFHRALADSLCFLECRRTYSNSFWSRFCVRQFPSQVQNSAKIETSIARSLSSHRNRRIVHSMSWGTRQPGVRHISTSRSKYRPRSCRVRCAVSAIQLSVNKGRAANSAMVLSQSATAPSLGETPDGRELPAFGACGGIMDSPFWAGRQCPECPTRASRRPRRP